MLAWLCTILVLISLGADEIALKSECSGCGCMCVFVNNDPIRKY